MSVRLVSSADSFAVPTAVAFVRSPRGSAKLNHICRVRAKSGAIATSSRPP